MMKRRSISLFLAVALLISFCSALIACENGIPGGDGGDGSKITALRITGRPTGDTIYFQEDTTFTLDFEWDPADESVPEVEWTSSNTNVATMSTASGIKVRQKGVGKTTISVKLKSDNTIADSFELSIIESPKTEITVDGAAASVGFQAFGTGIDSAMATVSEDKKEVIIDTGEVFGNGVGLWIYMPENAPLAKVQVYEVKVTAVVEELSIDYGTLPNTTALEVRTGAPISASDDWARYAPWPSANNITGKGTFNFHGYFTTGNTDAGVAKWTAIKFNNASPLTTAVKMTIKNIELRTITTENSTLTFTSSATSYNLSQFEGSGTVTAERKFQILDAQNQPLSGLGAALKTVYASSDSEVIELKHINNGVIKGLKGGVATISVYVEGVYDETTDSGYMTCSKDITIVDDVTPQDTDVHANIRLNGIDTDVVLDAKNQKASATAVEVNNTMFTVKNKGEENQVITFDTGNIYGNNGNDKTKLPYNPTVMLKLPAPLEAGEMYFIHYHIKVETMWTFTAVGASDTEGGAVAINTLFGSALNSAIVANQNDNSLVSDGVIRRATPSTMERDRNCVLTASANDDLRYVGLIVFAKYMDVKVEITDIEINKLDDTNCVVKMGDGRNSAAGTDKALHFSMQYIGEGKSKDALVKATDNAGGLGVYVTWASSNTSVLTVTNNNTTTGKVCSSANSTMKGLVTGTSTVSFTFGSGSVTTGADGSAMSWSVSVTV